MHRCAGDGNDHSIDLYRSAEWNSAWRQCALLFDAPFVAQGRRNKGARVHLEDTVINHVRWCAKGMVISASYVVVLEHDHSVMSGSGLRS